MVSFNFGGLPSEEELEKVKAQKEKIKAAQIAKQDSNEAFEERGEQSSSLIDPKLAQQQSLLAKSLKDSFINQRGAVSQAAQQAGGRRSTSYSNALGGQMKREGSVMSGLIADTLGKQIGLDEAQRGRDFTGEQAQLQRDLSREQFKQKMAFKQSELDAKERASDKAFAIDTAKQIGGYVTGFPIF